MSEHFLLITKHICISGLFRFWSLMNHLCSLDLSGKQIFLHFQGFVLLTFFTTDMSSFGILHPSKLQFWIYFLKSHFFKSQIVYDLNFFHFCLIVLSINSTFLLLWLWLNICLLCMSSIIYSDNVSKELQPSLPYCVNVLPWVFFQFSCFWVCSPPSFWLDWGFCR